MPTTPVQNARAQLRALKSGKVKSIRDPTKYKDLLTPNEYQELIDLINSKIKTEITDTKFKGTLQEMTDIINSRDTKDNTKKTHINSVKSLLKIFKVNTLEEVIKNNTVDNINKVINENYKSPAGLYNILLLFFDNNEELKNTYKSKYNKLKEQTGKTKDETTLNSYTKRLEDTNDYQTEYNNIINKTNEDDTLNLIHKLYTIGINNHKGQLTMIPRNYFKNVRLVEEDINTESENWYNYNTGRLVINDHKTSNKFKYNYFLPDEVVTLIEKSIQDKPRLFLFSNQLGNMPIDENMLQKKIKLALGVSINEYRKIMENYFIQFKNIPIETVEKAMGHQLTTSLISYKQNS